MTARSNRNTHARLRRDVAKLKKQMKQVELKFFDKIVTQNLVTVSGTTQAQLFTIAQNDT